MREGRRTGVGSTTLVCEPCESRGWPRLVHQRLHIHCSPWVLEGRMWMVEGMMVGHGAWVLERSSWMVGRGAWVAEGNSWRSARRTRVVKSSPGFMRTQRQLEAWLCVRGLKDAQYVAL
jgi:hypothetical protein